ncbi:MAG TPA: GNAT family N-acetyltransferase [Gaiellaceae bacterium]|nr:GNAT family N-acetyltransferase [Gaiellaceae bacterium]
MATAAGDSVDVILRDGGTLRLRPPGRDDGDALLDFFRALSQQSLRRRFHGLPNVRPELVEPLLEPDWTERGALLGTLADEEGERVVAVANYVRLRDPAVAESAFAVADVEQGRGIGTRLLERLAARAAAVGIARFVAEVLPENRSMLGVFEKVGFELKRELSSGVVEVEFPITSTEAYELSVEERDHTAVVASLRPFFEPQSVAVVGASPRRGTIGGELFRNVLQGDFAGAAYPVNPKGAAVAGVRGYTSVSAIPDPVDLAVVSVPGEHVYAAAEDALRSGVRALVVISAGFAEIGSEGAERQERLLALVRAHGARLIGPNCLGIAVAGPRLNATFAARSAPSGNIGFSSQSGALGLALLEAADSRGLGLSAFVSIGNKADVSSNDLLEWWEEDDATDVVLLYVESFGNPRRFGRLARRVARRKPILALKSGTSATGQRAASSHTAALAGSEAGVDALFGQAGVIRATSLEELIDVATLLSSQPEPKGRRVAVLTNAGGLGILAADACDAAGLELPELSEDTVAKLREWLPAEASFANPVDMLGSATAASYAQALPAVLADPLVDAALVLFVPAVTSTADQVAAAVDGATREAGSDKPVLAVVMSSEGVPDALRAGSAVAAFAYPESAARALGRVAGRAEWLRRPVGIVPELENVDRTAAAAVVERALDRAEDSWLDPADTRALLAAYGVPFVPERTAATVDAAAAAAAELGYPVVVKSAVPGAHKTETGGVALNLEDEPAVRAAAERIGVPVIVQPMLRGGTELLAGLVQDPVFGPLVAFGPGGVFAELIGEVNLRIAPLTNLDAEELVTTGKAGTLVRGFRGAPPADAGALVDLVLRLAALGDEVPAVAELDLNPVLAFGDRCVAVDARVRIGRHEERRREKSW